MEYGAQCAAYTSIPARRLSSAVAKALMMEGQTTPESPILSLQTRSIRPTCSAKGMKTAWKTVHTWGGRGPHPLTVHTTMMLKLSATMMVRAEALCQFPLKEIPYRIFPPEFFLPVHPLSLPWTITRVTIKLAAMVVFVCTCVCLHTWGGEGGRAFVKRKSKIHIKKSVIDLNVKTK